jgi:hypothetical protein
MGIENNSSPEENSEAVESLQVSSDPPPGNVPCRDDHDCPPGQTCVNGSCQQGQEA